MHMKRDIICLSLFINVQSLPLFVLLHLWLYSYYHLIFFVFHNSFSATYPQFFAIKNFHKILLLYNAFTKSGFCGSLGISLSTGMIAGRGKVSYIWISPNPTEAGPTLEVVVAVYFKVVLKTE